ncbi:DUF1360 domain-containing protein [Bacillus kwashiorkori]|uniref:DUF1360 domain-containing protein n=1 Tax=Bacillus kwashiorkori TaxID=1522318 RepID=UPI0007806275|nr:DUF1360 domain-containing protein [Bacillus kwashiorkori]
MTDLNILTVIILGLASFRLTRLIVFDKITEFVRRPFFDEVIEKAENGQEEVYLVVKEGGWKRWIGELLSCYWCTGIWASIFLVLLFLLNEQIANIIILVLAVAAIGSIIETIISRILG